MFQAIPAHYIFVFLYLILLFSLLLRCKKKTTTTTLKICPFWLALSCDFKFHTHSVILIRKNDDSFTTDVLPVCAIL